MQAGSPGGCGFNTTRSTPYLVAFCGCFRLEKWKVPQRVSTAIFAILTGLAPPIAFSKNIVVTASTPPEIRNDQRCSLIEAITNANSDNGTHSDCVAGNGADVIVLPASSTQLLTAIHNSIYGATGLPVITSAISIEGNGSTIARESSAPSFRILAVAKEAKLQLHNTNISGGATSMEWPRQGGGVLNYGTLEVNNSNISNNTSLHHGGGNKNPRGKPSRCRSTFASRKRGICRATY